MITAQDLADGAIAAILTDLGLGAGGRLIPVCRTYGVSLDGSYSADLPTERLQLATYERGDVAPGLSIEAVPEGVSGLPMVVPGPILLRNIAITLRALWRDPPAGPTLTATPETLRRFLSALSKALQAIFEPRTIATNGAWTLPSGSLACHPYIADADEGALEIVRNETLHAVELVLTAYSIG